MDKIGQHKEQRVGIFVDVQNLYHSAKNLYSGRVNFQELIKFLLAGRRLVRIMAYVVKSEGIHEMVDYRAEKSGNENHASPASPAKPTGESSFFEALEKAGMELRLKDLQVYPGGMKKADWDVGMAVDAIRMASALDAVILVTGDGDFVPLVEYLKWGLGKQVEVAAFGRSTSSKLKEASDYFVNIENIPRIIIKKHKVAGKAA